MAGLAAALSLSAAGRTVTVHEAGPAAGGRCRSYFDRELDLRVDNGNHLLLSGNTAALAYIEEIGAADRFHHPARPVFPFLDIKTRDRWAVRPNLGRFPWWIMVRGRRVPQTRLFDYLRMARIAGVKDHRTVSDAMRRGWLYWRLVEPLAVAALNTRPQAALARLLARVMQETLLKGGRACIPWLPKEGLSEALVDPAIATLTARGVSIRFGRRIAELSMDNRRVTGIRGPDGVTPLGPSDAVVLAVPPWVAVDLLPGLAAPNAYEAILNIHFRCNAVPDGPVRRAGFVGLTSGTAEWVFIKRDHVSVTISAANSMVDEDPHVIASLVWPNVRQALGLPSSGDDDLSNMPPFRVVKEKRATFAATVVQEARRPKTMTPLAANLALAGDWTDTGLPATIEGAIRSGRTAAQAVLAL